MKKMQKFYHLGFAKLNYSGNMRALGEMAEWSNALVLKTSVGL
jgi:hypothetical protein